MVLSHPYNFAAVGIILTLSLISCKNEVPNKKVISSTNTRIGNMLGTDTGGGFARVHRQQDFSFPADHGPHSNYKQERWQFSGNLATVKGEQIGYQISIQRLGLTANSDTESSSNYIPGSNSKIKEPSTWRTNSVYLVNLTITDAATDTFYQTEKISRDALDLSHVKITDTDAVDLNGHFVFKSDDWKITSASEDLFPLRVNIDNKDFTLDLSIYSKKKIVFNGSQGLAQKGPDMGNASYYYSFTRLRTSGDVTLKGKKYRVRGSSWFDHEWGTDISGNEVKGVDWFALQLADGRELSFYRIRDNQDKLNYLSDGKIVYTTDRHENIQADDFEFHVHNKWTSPASGITYPVSWDVRIPKYRISLHLTPIIKQQEIRQARTYWEGSIKVAGYQNVNSTSLKTINGYGYMRLMGYQ